MKKNHFIQKQIINSSGNILFQSKINYESTDGKGNFYWYQQTATPNYLNLPDVRAALHIPTFVGEWADCK